MQAFAQVHSSPVAGLLFHHFDVAADGSRPAKQSYVASNHSLNAEAGVGNMKQWPCLRL